MTPATSDRVQRSALAAGEPPISASTVLDPSRKSFPAFRPVNDPYGRGEGLSTRYSKLKPPDYRQGKEDTMITNTAELQRRLDEARAAEERAAAERREAAAALKWMEKHQTRIDAAALQRLHDAAVEHSHEHLVQSIAEAREHCAKQLRKQLREQTEAARSVAREADSEQGSESSADDGSAIVD